MRATFVVGLLFCSLGVLNAEAAVPQSERDALISFYNATNGASWKVSTGWLGAPGTECSWFGVRCNPTQTNVTSLSFFENNLTGTLPSQLSQLPELEELYLFGNHIGGSLPASIGTLSKLRSINAQANDFTGPIPDSFGMLTRLERLIFNDNQLTGVLPASLGNLTNLTNLELSANQFDAAPVPDFIRNFRNLRLLFLTANKFNGPLPDFIGTLTELERLELRGNDLTGPIPESLVNLTKLTDLVLSGNAFTGAIPSSIGALTQLKLLRLEANDFTGALPESLGNLTKLANFDVSGNSLTGSIPSSIGNLKELVFFAAEENQLTGPLPGSLGNLTKLEFLQLFGNAFTGDFPQELGNLGKLRRIGITGTMTGSLPAGFGTMRDLEIIDLSGNRMSGEVPAGLWGLPKLKVIYLFSNNFSGQIPPTIGDSPDMEGIGLAGNSFSGVLPDVFDRMPVLTYFNIGDNDFTGTFPRSFLAAPRIAGLLLYGNRFTGPIPPELGDKTTLDNLALGGNQFTGTIPPELGKLSNLLYLWLGGNLLTGGIPESLGQLTNLEWLALYGNQLRGEVPVSLLNLVDTPNIDLGDNALTTSNTTLRTLLDQKGSFTARQTVPPTNVAVDSTSAFTAVISWAPIAYTNEAGGYQVLASTTPGGPYTPLITTPSKQNSSALVTGLQPSTRYYFVVQTITYPHGGSPFYQLSTIFSDRSNEVSAMTVAATNLPADIIVTAFPSGIVQSVSGGGADSYTLTNVGGSTTTITLSQSGSFFDQSPPSFTLEPGASQAILLTGRAAPAGEYSGTSVPSGSGVPSALSIPVRLVSSVAQASGFVISADRSRIDLIAPAEVNPTGMLVFRNSGTAAFTGVASADVQFLIPQAGLIVIPAGGTAEVTVMSDRSRRPDATALNGTQEGRVALVAIGGFSAKSPFDGSTAALAAVIDTVKPPTTTSGIPPLGPGEVAYFLSSVGHVVGSVGEFLSDISIVNAYGTSPANDLKLFYTRSGSSTSSVASANALASNQALALADVVKSVFGGTAEVGTLQIRSARAPNLSVSANIFNASNPAGNYGTAIPVFRSDRFIRTGQELFITGLRKDDSGHTNLFLQEVRGLPVTARIDSLGANGAILATRMETLAPFALRSIVNELTTGTVAVRIRNESGGGGLNAYATPVDRASGDTWAVADWSLQQAYDPASPIVFPVAGSVRGANRTFFRTDVAITNRCSLVVNPLDANLLRTTPCRGSSSRGTLRYRTTTGDSFEKVLDLGLLETVVITDVVRQLFGITTDTIGHITFTPAFGSFAATSRTYTTSEGSVATFGTAVPAVGVANAIRPGQSRRIGALSDSTTATIGRGTPGSNRTNFGIVETAGESARVRVSVFYNDPKSLASGKPIGTKIYDLAPNQLITVSNLVRAIIGEARETLYGDLSGVQIQFDVISAGGAVSVYTSSLDNGTGDAILRTE